MIYCRMCSSTSVGRGRYACMYLCRCSKASIDLQNSMSYVEVSLHSISVSVRWSMQCVLIFRVESIRFDSFSSSISIRFQSIRFVSLISSVIGITFVDTINSRRMWMVRMWFEILDSNVIVVSVASITTITSTIIIIIIIIMVTS